jgi:hypothetical protein
MSDERGLLPPAAPGRMGHYVHMWFLRPDDGAGSRGIAKDGAAIKMAASKPARRTRGRS